MATFRSQLQERTARLRRCKLKKYREYVKWHFTIETLYLVTVSLFIFNPIHRKGQSENRRILLQHPVEGYFEGRIYNSRNGLVIARQSV